MQAVITRPLALMAKPRPDGGYAVAPAGVEFTLRSPYLDLAELLPPTPGGPMMANARGRRPSRWRGSGTRSSTCRTSRPSSRSSPGPRRSRATRSRAYGGFASGKAEFDFRDPAHPKTSVQSQLDSARVESLLGTWTKAGEIMRGIVNIQGNVSTQGTTPEEIARTLSADGVAFLGNGQVGPLKVLDEIAALTKDPRLRELRFRDVKCPFHVERGRVLPPGRPRSSGRTATGASPATSASTARSTTPRPSRCRPTS